ncbi:MAG TPA: histidine phosphatase family protein [Sporichthyaceae bacterium]|jgi:probable phosphoglycerate mutase|nr:histidine phosphatase family protein [Sporichthyaceae bacterium]
MTDASGAVVAEKPKEYAQYRFRIPPTATDVLLVRHGESAPMPASPDLRTNSDGQADPELSPLGVEQARLTGERLAGAGLQAIYVTSLRRTQQTAVQLATLTGLEPQIEPDLREIFLGEWEGGEFRRRAQVRDPRMVQLLAGADWDVVPGAEPSEKFAARVHGALTRIHEAHPGQRVAVICHGGVIGQALALATGSRTLAFMSCDNASISQLILHGDHWIVRRYNDTHHLGPAFTAAAAPIE